MSSPPTVPAAPPRRRLRRVLLIAVAVVLALAVVAAAAVVLVVRDLEGDVDREDVFGRLEEQDRPQEEPTEALDVLVLGSDGREGAGAAYQAGANADVEGERADTTLLVHVSADRQSAQVVSIPRDLWTDLPACTTAEGERLPAREGQFNGAFLDGGLACTVRAVEKLSGIRIDHTAVVDFRAFRDMVDALDGVPVCLEEPFEPRMADVSLPAGRSLLDGREALEYVRARFGVGDGSDLSRIERQKAVIASMLDRALSRQLLVRPDRLVRFLSAATSNLRVDDDLDLRGLALSLRGLDLDRVALTTLPLDADPGPDYAAGGRLAGRVAVDEPAAAELFADLRADRPLQASAAPSASAPAKEGAAPPAASPPPTATAAESACR